MKKSQNPFELHTITPYLTIDDVPRFIQFLETVFDAEQRGKLAYRDDGTVQHAEIKIGDSVIMLGEPSDKFPYMTPSKTGSYVYVDDCDETYKKALECGAKSLAEPANYPHGDRYGGIEDFAGNLWWIVTHIGK